MKLGYRLMLWFARHELKHVEYRCRELVLALSAGTIGHDEYILDRSNLDCRKSAASADAIRWETALQDGQIKGLAP